MRLNVLFLLGRHAKVISSFHDDFFSNSYLVMGWCFLFTHKKKKKLKATPLPLSGCVDDCDGEKKNFIVPLDASQCSFPSWTACVRWWYLVLHRFKFFPPFIYLSYALVFMLSMEKNIATIELIFFSDSVPDLFEKITSNWKSFFNFILKFFISRNWSPLFCFFFLNGL